MPLARMVCRQPIWALARASMGTRAAPPIVKLVTKIDMAKALRRTNHWLTVAMSVGEILAVRPTATTTP